MYGTINIIESMFLTVPEERFVQRSWRERLFSWPWRPWIALKTITVQVPDTKVYVVGSNVYCHPSLAVDLRERLLPHDACSFDQYYNWIPESWPYIGPVQGGVHEA